MKLLFAAGLLILLFAAPILSQVKYETFILGQLEELPEIVVNEDQAILYIVSEVPDVQVESTLRLIETKQLSTSEWQIAVTPDRQMLTIRAAGYLSAQTDVLSFKAKHAYRLTISKVKPPPGTLFITTQPEGANLRINGALVDGQTPFRLEQVPPGQYYVQVRKEGHRPVEKKLNVESNQVAAWDIDLTQTAVRVQIDIENNVQDATLFIDGQTRGMAPSIIYLDPGSYKLTLKKEGYSDFEKVIEIPLDVEQARFSLKLESTASKASKEVAKGFFSFIRFAVTIVFALFVAFAIMAIQQ